MCRHLRKGLLPALLMVALTHPAAVLAKGLSSGELQQRSRDIERMTLVERESLQRNWQIFQTLPEDQKQRYRDLHQQLEDDRLSGGNQLNLTLQTYEAWLQTLTPGERDELRKAADAKERLDKVRKIKADQEQRNQSRVLNESGDDSSRQWWRNRQIRAKPLTAAELNDVLAALAASLPISDQQYLERLDPEQEKMKWYRGIIEASAREADGPQHWPNPSQQAAMAAAIPKSETVQRLKNLKEDQKRGLWFMILFSSLREEFKKQHEPFQPKEGELAQYFDQLGSQDREQLMALPQDRFRFALMKRYFDDLEQKNEDYRRLARLERECFVFYARFMSEAGFPPRGGGGPWGRFGPPDRPMFRGDPGPDGPRFGRPPRGDRDGNRRPPPPERRPEE